MSAGNEMRVVGIKRKQQPKIERVKEERRKRKAGKGRDLDGVGAKGREEEAPWLTDEEEGEGNEEQHKESQTEKGLKDDRHSQWVP